MRPLSPGRGYQGRAPPPSKYGRVRRVTAIAIAVLIGLAGSEWAPGGGTPRPEPRGVELTAVNAEPAASPAPRSAGSAGRTAVVDAAAEAGQTDHGTDLAEVRRRVADRTLLRPEHDVPAHDHGLRPSLPAREDDSGRRPAREARLSAVPGHTRGALPSRRRSRRTAPMPTSRTTRCTVPVSGLRATTCARRRRATTRASSTGSTSPGCGSTGPFGSARCRSSSR